MPQDLTVKFGNILETPTVFPDEQGKLEITVTNQGDEDATDATLKLYASTDSSLDNLVFSTQAAFNEADPEDRRRALNTNEDTISRPGENDPRPNIPDGAIDALRGTDELLGTISGVNLASGEENTFTIDFASDDFRTASVVSPGAYNLIAEVKSDESSDQATQFISSDGTDVVLDWNSTFLNAVQAEGKAEQDEGLNDNSTTATIPGVAPPVVARDGAILHTAIYQAVNALSDSPNGSFSNLPSVPEGASQEAAAVGAAYGTLTALFPEQKAVFDAQYDLSLSEISDDPAAKDAGFDFGEEVAKAILAERSNDGASFAQVPYTPGTAAGDYKEIREPDPTQSLPGNLDENGLVETTALLPNWGRVEPFAINSTADFLPGGPPAFSSPNYARDIERVQGLGGLVDTEATDVIRTDEQTEIAQFWSYDRPETFRPPGQWNEIAQEVALDQGNSLEDNALLFAELNVAMADAGIVTWDGKYAYEQLRPVTAIRNADDDNNPNTTADPDWEPLIRTPNFPDYISGHSAFGGAAAGVLEDFFGEDVSFEIPTQELPGVSREFTSLGSMSSFEVAARENADSREFGGVHVEISNVDGVATGLDVANYILNEADLFV
ncbi:vanadium-dependent haloperoxidase [Pleurocapsa sp. FMAR1]|uniref:vanadium-dependent haloperoxidase n=1 Tax=Pleurocapsa sp. FMAR1 TaxID=3040204 RepID=UPI0029C72C6E|nr:CARDB domain-containing protein [Pleurocapsa sp. FMAR1]